MPAQSAFRSFVGVAKDTINANLSATYPSTTTSWVLNNVVGTPTSSMSMVLVDGPLTETLVVSSWTSGTSTLVTTAGSTNAHSANVYAYFQTTSSIGPTAFLRYTKTNLADLYAELYDVGFRGSLASKFGAQQGMRVGNWSLEGDFFADEFGYIAAMFFGAYDYTATSGGNPTTYAFSQLNTGTGQPTPYLLYIYNPGAQTCYVMAKALASDLSIKYDPGALIHWTASGKGFAMGPVATPTNTYSSFTPVASRTGIATISGTVNPYPMTAEYTFKREEFGEINTIQGIQDPLAIFTGPVSLNTKITAVQPDNTQYLNYVNISQPSFNLTATKGATTAANGLQIHCNVANYEALSFDQTGKAYVTQDFSFEALSNTTDASTAGGGYSPAKLTLSVGTNTGSTTY